MLLIHEKLLKYRGGRVKTSEEAYALMQKYKSIDNMPKQVQNEFKSTFKEAINDTLRKHLDSLDERDSKNEISEGISHTMEKYYREEYDILLDEYEKFTKSK